ncbi:MAG TPA: oxidoreductase [Mycobacteriales bacterium]|nr:oxidoreductase [Mycobacteriales bacterium]
MPPDALAALLDLPGVRDAAEGSRVAVDRLLAHRALRRSSAAVSAESALRGARASAALDGVDVPLADVRAGVVADPVVQGALRVSAELGRLAGTWVRAPLQVLARLHVLAAADLLPEAELGRPVAGVEIAVRLDGLAGLVTAQSAGPSAGPAVLLAAVVHGELRALAPFRAGSGVVARAAARLTTISRGLDPKALAVPEVGHMELKGEYDETLAGYLTGEPDGVAAWLRHCCAAAELGAREGLAICEAVLRG